MSAAINTPAVELAASLDHRLDAIRATIMARSLLEAMLRNAINDPVKAARRDRIGLAIAGGAFILLRIGSDYITSPTRFQERTVALALALAAGAAGAFIPGVLAAEAKRPAAAIRATGAIGLAAFIVILFHRFIA